MPAQNNTNFDNCVSFFIDNDIYQGRLIRLNEVINTISMIHLFQMIYSQA